MTFKEMYCGYNEEIKPDGALVERMQEIAQASEGKKVFAGNLRRVKAQEPDFTEESPAIGFMKRVFTCIKPIAAVAAASMCLLIAMPVLADNLPYVEKLLNLISPELAQQFVPVQMSDESQGIRMEVVGIHVKEDGVQVYVTMQDLEGNRLDESTDLYDSYSLHVPFDSVSNCQNLGYDAETKTITFLININAMEGAKENWFEKIRHQRITFSIREIIGQKTKYEAIEIPIPLAEADLNAEAMSTHLRGGSGWYAKQSESLLDPMDPRPVTRVLCPGEGDERLAIEGIEFTGLGYVDGYLHVQYGVPNLLETDNHGYFFLKDAAGNERLYDGKVSFFGTTKETEHISYEDCIFDISPEKLSDYTLYGYFVTSGLQLEGNWEVKFRLNQ